MSDSISTAVEFDAQSKKSLKINAFTRYVRGAPSALPELPIVHTTNFFCLREIAEFGQMTPQPCDVFIGENLLYFFYGKPSYRLFAEYDSGLCAEAPIAIILSSKLAVEAKRIFPFDSGGFERYRKFMPRQLRLPHFELDQIGCQAGQIVTSFFRSNAEYFDGKPRSDLCIPADQFEAESFSQLLNYKGKDPLDDRAWSIELQIPQVIPLNSKTVLSVVMPENSLDTDTGRKITNEWGVTPLTYSLSGRGTPIEYHAMIRALTREFLEKEGYL